MAIALTVTNESNENINRLSGSPGKINRGAIGPVRKIEKCSNFRAYRSPGPQYDHVLSIAIHKEIPKMPLKPNTIDARVENYQQLIDGVT
ncbi:MAG: hypothetical protein GDA43_00665 [Hormoscilla sp. SP5CHS1]|nr:hypothetical protein [Hormoscilla sp. SP5CHS1]